MQLSIRYPRALVASAAVLIFVVLGFGAQDGAKSNQSIPLAPRTAALSYLVDEYEAQITNVQGEFVSTVGEWEAAEPENVTGIEFDATRVNDPVYVMYLTGSFIIHPPPSSTVDTWAHDPQDDLIVATAADLDPDLPQTPVIAFPAARIVFDAAATPYLVELFPAIPTGEEINSQPIGERWDE
jgi:hypothetical protein